MDIKILVATHKEYWLPKYDVYLPIHVGCKGQAEFGYVGDNTGYNISEKNKNYCELTGLYWAWKNLKCDYLGLCHYRRYFGRNNYFDGTERLKQKIFQRSDYEKLLASNDVILPIQRKYYIETVRSQYEHAHSSRDLDQIERILTEHSPNSLRSFRAVMNRRRLHLWNMFVMKKSLADKYCEWLFNILFKYEKWMDEHNLFSEKFRLFGFISERLLDVWLFDKNLKIAEADVVMLEKINWIKKGSDFLRRKFFGNN